MNKISIIILITTLGLSGCESNKELEFRAPIGPYGLPYRVGSLAGKPVNLGEEVGWLEYEDSPLLKRENRYKGYKPPPRNYQSVVTGFEIILKYTTGVPLMRYYKAPQDAVKQYDAEQNDPNNKWIYIGVSSGLRYLKNTNLTEIFFKTLSNEKDQPSSKAENYKFHFKYLPTNEIDEGLEKYIPHPIWVEFYDYENTDDLYIQKNNENKVLTSIRCSNTKVDLARKCSMTWTLEPKMKILLKVTFQRGNLKDWKLIKKRSEEAISKLFISK